MKKPLPRCSQDLYLHGEHIMTIADVPSEKIEEWVVKVRKESKQKVDWHFVGGRACVLYLGNKGRVVQAIHNHLEELTAMTTYWRFTTDDDSVIPMSVLQGLAC